MSQLPSGLSSEVGRDEEISRVLRHSRFRRKSDNGIKLDAFMPAPDNDTSVMRVTGLGSEQINELAVQMVPEKAKNGSALFEANVALDQGLEFFADDTPPRHANLRGWPKYESDSERERLERRAIAAILAEESTWLAPTI